MDEQNTGKRILSDFFENDNPVFVCDRSKMVQLKIFPVFKRDVRIINCNPLVILGRKVVQQVFFDTAVFFAYNIFSQNNPFCLPGGREVLSGKASNDSQLCIKLERHIAVSNRNYIVFISIFA